MNDFQLIDAAIRERNSHKRRFRISHGRWRKVHGRWKFEEPYITLYELKFHGWEWYNSIKQKPDA